MYKKKLCNAFNRSILKAQNDSYPDEVTDSQHRSNDADIQQFT